MKALQEAMMNISLMSAVAGGVALLVVPAMAQDRSGVDQLTATSEGRVDQVSVPTGAAIGQIAQGTSAVPAQISSTATDPSQPQLSDTGQAGPSPQISRLDRSAGVTVVPASLRDACEEAAAGRRSSPEGVDCSVVLEAVAGIQQPSAEEALLLGSGGLIRQQQQAAQTGQSQTFDANDVARRLASGDVQNAPLAQAIASGLNPPPPTQPQAPGPVVIIPGRSGGTAPPPGN